MSINLRIAISIASEIILTKLIHILFLFFCLNIAAQDSVVFPQIAVDTVAKKQKFKETDILIDSSQVEKRSFLPNLKEKYNDNEFIYEQKVKEKSAWTRFIEWLSYWIDQIFNIGSDGASKSVLEVIVKIIAFAIIIFVIYLIVKAIMNDEGQWIFGKSSDKKVINYDELEKNLQIIDFEKLIKEALKSGENRLAIRYHYLWLLKQMAAKEIIEWDVEKTNSDYVYEIKSVKLKEEFTYLSYLYNYIWYGEFELEENELEKAIKAFQKTIQTL